MPISACCWKGLFQLMLQNLKSCLVCPHSQVQVILTFASPLKQLLSSRCARTTSSVASWAPTELCSGSRSPHSTFTTQPTMVSRWPVSFIKGQPTMVSRFWCQPWCYGDQLEQFLALTGVLDWIRGILATYPPQTSINTSISCISLSFIEYIVINDCNSIYILRCYSNT